MQTRVPGRSGQLAARHAKPIRCAVYTRVSTDHGLEQDFNSLDAQREASAAYVKSQMHEGWVLARERYDDGGFSGGSLDRPALQGLLADIAEGKVDTVVVYKVDRLTRSLTDFAKLISLFETHDVSFVSVTQSFNTTTSMGRLTLNVLLSFAQFEREVAGERIRDKVAASKKKGIWLGGTVPFGYRVEDRKLVIDEAEAATVRMIFHRYRDLGAMTPLLTELRQRGVTTRQRRLATGKVIGGIPVGRGALGYLLKNRTYIGELNHKDRSYTGEHPAIIDRELFDAVQARLIANRAVERHRQAHSDALLLGRIFDDRGNRMTPTHSRKNGAHYRYYTSRALADGRADEAGSVTRVPAPEVEELVVGAVRRALGGDAQADLSESPGLALGPQAQSSSAPSVESPRANSSEAPLDNRSVVAEHVERVVIKSGAVAP
jgi:site-specific DNA recombinase